MLHSDSDAVRQFVRERAGDLTRDYGRSQPRPPGRAEPRDATRRRTSRPAAVFHPLFRLRAKSPRWWAGSPQPFVYDEGAIRRHPPQER